MSRPLRILHVGNGRAFKIKAIADAFVARGHEVHMVAIPPAPGDWSGVKWHQLPAVSLPGQAKVAARMLQFRALARRLQPDVVHAHNAWGPGWYGAVAGVHPFVVHAYGGDVLPEQYAGRPAIQRRMTSWTCRTADRIVVTGGHMVGAAAALGIAAERMMLLPRGVDLERYRPGLDVSALRQQLGIPTNAVVLLSPRYQVDEQLYNLDVVVEALSLIRHRYPAAVCVQLFDPTREAGRAALEREAAVRGVADAYKLVPAVNNGTMPLFYNLADVVVSIPSSDGFPVTVLEASACAVPLVVSDLAYVSDWFQNGCNGLVVPVRNAGAVADAVEALLGNAEWRRQMGAAARAAVEARADYRRCMDRLETVYRELLAHTGPNKA